MAEGEPVGYDQTAAAQVHTTTTTTTTSTSSSTVDISCDLNYLRSIQGILKIVEIVLSLIAFCVILTPYYRGPSHNFFLFVAISCCLVSSCVFILFITKIIYKITSVPWNLILAILYIVMALGYSIGFILVAVNAYTPAHGSAATLGCFASVVYLMSMLFALRDFRAASNLAESTSPRSTHESTEAPPSYTPTTLYDPKY